MNSLVALLSLFLAAPIGAAVHPLEPLSADEHLRAYALVRAQLAEEELLFPFIALREPAKAAVLSGTGIAREAEVHVVHPPTNCLWIAVVDLTAGRVTQFELAEAGQGTVTAEEYVVADELVRAYEPWAAAMRARGLDPDHVYVDVWAPGDQELPASAILSHGPRTRLLRALSFLRGGSVDDYDPEQPQNPYVRPVEGVVVTIDMNARRVVHMTDSGIRPVSRESGNAATPRTGLQPMRVVQPNGGGFTVEGRLVRWQNWRFYVVLHPREGLVLHDVRYRDGDRLRRIAHRMSLSEIYVPYGIADENWSWRTAFDVGEYNLGTFAQSLEPDRDVPEHAYLFDAVFGTDTGRRGTPRTRWGCTSATTASSGRARIRPMPCVTRGDGASSSSRGTRGSATTSTASTGSSAWTAPST